MARSSAVPDLVSAAPLAGRIKAASIAPMGRDSAMPGPWVARLRDGVARRSTRGYNLSPRWGDDSRGHGKPDSMGSQVMVVMRQGRCGWGDS